MAYILKIILPVLLKRFFTKGVTKNGEIFSLKIHLFAY